MSSPVRLDSRRHDGCPLFALGTEMIESPRGPSSLPGRFTRLSSISLVAIVVVLLISPLGEGNSPDPTAPALPTVLTSAPFQAPALNQQPPAADDGEQQPPVVTDPAVLAILESNPQTPDQQLQAVLTLIDLGSAASGAKFLDALIDAQLDDDALYQLSKKFGSAAVLKLGRDSALQPKAGEFAKTLLTTAARVARDPARLKDVAADLASDNEETRFRAMAELRHGGAQSAAVLIGLLADDDRTAASGTAGDDVIDDDVLETALIAMRADAVAPLCGALDCPKPRVRVFVANVLAQLRSSNAVKFLLPDAVSDDATVRSATLAALQSLTAQDLSPQEVAQYLYAEAKALYLGEPVWGTDAAEETRLWSWSADEQTVVAHNYTQLNASYVAAALLAQKLHKIAPQAEAATNLYINATLQAAVSQRGENAPPADETIAPEVIAPDAIRGLGPAAVNAALADALAERRHLAVWGALKLLGEIGDERLLHVGGQEVAPLAAACSNADPRVRFAAADTILRLQPKTDFPGSSSIIRTLGHFAASRGKPRVMIGDTRALDARQLAGLVMMTGYRADTANYSRALIEQALQSPDYQAVLLDVTLPNANIDLIVQQLRKDARTAALPIGFMAPLDRQVDAEAYARRYGSSEVFVRPYSEEVLTQQLDHLLQSAEIAPLSADERLDYANASLAWLTKLTDGGQPLFNPIQEATTAQNAMYVPELAAAAIDFQAACGLPESQTALLSYASTISLPAELRRQAAAGFARSLEKYGVLLTTSQIALQYDRYNASSAADEDTIDILASLLDAIEATAAARNAGGR